MCGKFDGNLNFVKSILSLILLLFVGFTFGQSLIRVSGKVTEARTGTPIPFANVFFKGTTEGAITDFDGNFDINTTSRVDSVEVRYIGYVSKVKALGKGGVQVLNFQLEENLTQLDELVVYSGENPAWPIMRNVIESKRDNDKRSLDSYEYESYTKIEVDIDNISTKFKNRKLVKKITSVLDSIEQIAGEDGMPVLPVFISEAISRFYYRSNPDYRKEEIIKTKLRGVGLTDGSTTSQLIGSTFQEYNFYQNWLNIVEKEFISPLAGSWKANYHYYLEDSLYVGEDFCYRIEFEPKEAQNLAFSGNMWITKDEYALKRIDATVSKTANLNFIEKIKIQQDLKKTEGGAWLPEKSRVVVDVSQISKKTAGLIAKFYVSAKDFVVNDPKPVRFYQNPVTMQADALVDDPEYWVEHRHDTLTATEQNVYRMIDTIRYIPTIKLLTDAVSFLASGYIPINKYVDIGPYSTFFGNNSIEGIRIGAAARTRIALSKHFTLGGYYGYGFDDKDSKYLASLELILNRNQWTTLRFERQREVEQIWLLNQNVAQNSFFYSFSRFGTLTQPFLFEKNRISFSRQLPAGWQQSIELKQQSFEPLFDFRFARGSETDPAEFGSNFDISEVTFTTRWGRDELFVINDNQRISLGTTRYPAFTFSYTYGLRDVLGSDFEYHRLRLSIEKKQKLGILGVSRYQINSGIIFGDIPYPLLYNPIGNETLFYVRFAYNLMDFFEFSTDRFIELRYRHSFEGLVLNHIPLMKKLKWRLVANANLLYGSIRDENLELGSQFSEEGEAITPFTPLTNTPYIELGYGIENIFKVFRIDAFHRLTYLDRPGTDKFGAKISFQLIL